MSTVLNRILSALSTDKRDDRLHFHTILLNSADARTLDLIPGATDLKSTVWLAKDGNLTVTTTLADERVAPQALKAAVGSRRSRLAPEDLVKQQLGITRGAVAPFGYPPHTMCLIDSKVFLAAKVLISPGINDATFELTKEEFSRLADYFACTKASISRPPSSASDTPHAVSKYS